MICLWKWNVAKVVDDTSVIRLQKAVTSTLLAFALHGTFSCLLANLLVWCWRLRGKAHMLSTKVGLLPTGYEELQVQSWKTVSSNDPQLRSFTEEPWVDYILWYFWNPRTQQKSTWIAESMSCCEVMYVYCFKLLLFSDRQLIHSSFSSYLGGLSKKQWINTFK